MEPYYTDDWVTLYHSDFRDIIQDLTYDCIITDPIWPNAPEGMFDIPDGPAHLLSSMALAAAAKRIVVILRSDSDPRILQEIGPSWPFFCCVALPYAIPNYNGRKLGGLEIAYCFGEPIKSREGQRVIPFMGPKVQPTQKGDFPCPRSLNHMLFLVRWWCDEGETLLDPFCGSGVILRAAKNLNRTAIGIDVNRTALDSSVNRLSQTVLPILA